MTRKQLTQSAGLPGLNGGGAAATVPLTHLEDQSVDDHTLAVLLSVAQSVSVAQHDTCLPLGQHIGSVYDTFLGTSTYKERV